MEIVGFIFAILIGIPLGLMGSGGSVFTIPILVYIMNIPPSEATAYSLFIVGVSALSGSIKGAKSKLLNYKLTLFFGIPSVISVFLMRKYILKKIPQELFDIHFLLITKDLLIMIVFAILMIFASISMIRKTEEEFTDKDTPINYSKMIYKGIIVGLLTGFVGVGGGFLIVPTLMSSAKLDIKKAIATSLIIISFNSLIGFSASLNNQTIDWSFLIEFSFFTIIGTFIGLFLNKKIDGKKLKPAFGWFVLSIGIYILLKETIFKN